MIISKQTLLHTNKKRKHKLWTGVREGKIPYLLQIRTSYQLRKTKIMQIKRRLEKNQPNFVCVNIKRKLSFV